MSWTPSPLSLWLARRGRPREVEVAVVGGGIVGLSTAWWLGKAGAEVLVLEAGALAGRASGRNAGFLLTGSPEPYAELAGRIGAEAARAFWELSRFNRELLRHEILDPGVIDCAFQPEGSYLATVAAPEDPDPGDAGDAPRDAVLRESAAALEAAGFDLELLEGEAASRRAGTVAVHLALHQPRDGALDPVALCRGLAERGDFAVRTGSRVHALEPTADGRVELVADGGSVVAERVVVALNAYVPALFPHLAGVVRPVRGQMLATAPGEPVLEGAWYLDDGYQYVRQLPDGAVVAGGCRRVAESSEVGYLEHPTATVQGALERFVKATWPALAERPVTRRWAGIMAFTDDGLPHLEEPAELPGTLVAAGFNGHGMSLGFATGKYLAGRVRGVVDGPLLPPPRSGS